MFDATNLARWNGAGNCFGATFRDYNRFGISFIDDNVMIGVLMMSMNCVYLHFKRGMF